MDKMFKDIEEYLKNLLWPYCGASTDPPQSYSE